MTEEQRLKRKLRRANRELEALRDTAPNFRRLAITPEAAQTLVRCGARIERIQPLPNNQVAITIGPL